MRKILYGSLIVVLLADSGISQVHPGMEPPDSSSAKTGPLTGHDAALPLLPETLGPMERVLWGKSGLMRNMGFPLDESTREREMHLRRKMLTLHQVGGFMTLAAMTGTVVTGQILLNSRPKSNDHANHGGAPPAEHDHGIHGVKSALTWTTVGLYSATMLLSVLSPPPMVRKPQWSTISWHKTLGLVHFTGMFVTPFLILAMDDSDNSLLYHQISGYTTLAAFAGAMLVVTF